MEMQNKINECNTAEERMKVATAACELRITQNETAARLIALAAAQLAGIYQDTALVNITKTDHVEIYLKYQINIARKANRTQDIQMYNNIMRRHKEQVRILSEQLKTRESMMKKDPNAEVTVDCSPEQIIRNLSSNKLLTGSVHYFNRTLFNFKTISFSQKNSEIGQSQLFEFI